ncbi:MULTISPECIES: hypothetical protein [Delftia]|nr:MULTISPECIES: hypothetical protein [Delftia]MBO1035811.1 hypothetical protein [Delftia sp. SD018]MCG3780533.1 hypothetical protein [Delftia acidovorans]
MNRKIFVVCPGGVVTGGPELLHQLVHELREIGLNAFISYYPFEIEFKTPEPYSSIYNITIAKPEKSEHNIMVIPESATRLAKKYDPMQIIIWWQSVDNYYRIPPQKGWRSWVPITLASRLARAPLNSLRRYTHLAQSEYAKAHLRANNISARMLGDYLTKAHELDTSEIFRSNSVAFNPRKGMKITSKLINALPHVKFQAIENMTTEQVNNILRSVKIYIDFGEHPGKDRLPREAALAGACIITGMAGAAANALDIPIPQSYKLNSSSENFIADFELLTSKIFNNFEQSTIDFEQYRKKILQEKEEFSIQCKNLFQMNISDI